MNGYWDSTSKMSFPSDGIMDRDNSRTYDNIIIITLKSPTTYIVCTLLHENIHSCSKDCTFFGANNGNVAPSKIHTSLITSTTIPLKKGY
jgi:hypothetical protein